MLPAHPVCGKSAIAEAPDRIPARLNQDNPAPGGVLGVGVGASGTIYFSSDIENAIYRVTKKLTI
jgi:hypothetical protein